MTIEGLHFLASGQVPHLDRVIYTSTDHGLSIRTNCHTLNTVCMTIEGLHFLANGQVPHLDLRIRASTNQGLSIGTDRDTAYIATIFHKTMANEGKHYLAS